MKITPFILLVFPSFAAAGDIYLDINWLSRSSFSVAAPHIEANYTVKQRDSRDADLSGHSISIGRNFGPWYLEAGTSRMGATSRARAEGTRSTPDSLFVSNSYAETEYEIRQHYVLLGRNAPVKQDVSMFFEAGLDSYETESVTKSTTTTKEYDSSGTLLSTSTEAPVDRSSSDGNSVVTGVGFSYDHSIIGMKLGVRHYSERDETVRFVLLRILL